MGAILDQLGLDQTFFIEFILFVVLFAFLSQLFFKPFLRLLQARHKKTVEDREAADQLMQQADAKFEEYRARLNTERVHAKQEFETLSAQVKKEESEIINRARLEAKAITQEAADSLSAQRDALKAQLTGEVEGLAKSISETLLSRKES